jgi:hypothetical protein
VSLSLSRSLAFFSGKASPREAVTGWSPSYGEICGAQSGGTFTTDKQVLPGLALLLLLSTSRFPLSTSFTNSGNCDGSFAKLNRELLGFTTVWWFERGPEDIGGSRTLVSNWWLVKSILGPKKLVGPEK